MKTAADTYEGGYVLAVVTCLQAVSTQVIQNHAADVHLAAATCATQFRKIKDTRGTGMSLGEKLTKAVDTKCAPGMLNVTHGVPDILGPGAALSEPIAADNLNAWCAHFGGDGSIDTLHEWSDCVAASHACAAQQEIVTQYPRALEWLAELRPAMLALTAPATDPTKITDAVAGLDAVVAAIDGPDADGVPNIECGSSCGDGVKNGSEACDGADLGGASCTTLGYATGTLSCTATCGFNTSGCGCRTATGNAAVADVLSGKTFSNSTSVGITGTMPNNGAVTLTPGTADQTIAAGYHNGTGKCVGDPDLVSGNIKSGVNLFGINGSPSVVDTSSGTATAPDMLSGKTAYVNGSLVTGSVPAGSNVSGANGLKTFTIPNGLYAGSKTATANDTNLAAGNIKNGTTIFGVSGDPNVVDTSGATWASDHIVVGQTCYANGSVVNGSAPLGSNVTGTNGSLTMAIPYGGYDGTQTCTANDTNLVAGNIVNAVSIFGVTGTALPAQRLKTGQATCYDSSGTVISCAGTGQDGELQKGVARSYTDNGDGTITDNKTGLMWEKLSDDGTIHDKDTRYTWSTAFTTKITTLNGGGGFAGHTDWRLPNINELQGLADYSTSFPALNAAFNTGCVPSCTVTTCSCDAANFYWSSTSVVPQPYLAWAFVSSGGYVNGDTRTNNEYVRAVRGGAPVTPPPAQTLQTGQTTSYGPGSDGALARGVARQYVDNGDGTITDTKTGLMWEKKDQSGGIHDWNNQYTWGMTSSPYTMNGTMVTTFLATLNGGGGFAGHTDWRIPNRFELESLVNLQNVSPAVDSAFNTSCAASCAVTTCSCTQLSNDYWSSTTYQGSPDIAWSMSFYVGSHGALGKSGSLYVRAVRGGS